MSRTRLIAVFSALFAALALLGQPVNGDCDNAVNLCARQPMNGDNTGALNSMPAYCQPGAQAVWYSFTTNSQGGPVSVTIDQMQCAVIAGMDNALGAVILAGDGSCVPNSFQAASACAHGAQGFTLTSSQALQAQTRYWIMVNGMRTGSNTMAAQCEFAITVSGPGVDVVGVDFSAGPDVTIAQGGSTQLLATGGNGYEWSPTAGLSGNTIPDPVAQPQETTAYTVTTRINDCTYDDTVVVWVRRLIQPVNTFTPNGDGINDTWMIPELRNYPQAEVSIYDRWGQRVYHSIGYKDPFDGAGLPVGTYYWYIQVHDPKGKSDPYTGYVTIVR